MPDSKLSQLAVKTALANNDLFLITDVAAGQSKSTTLASILTRIFTSTAAAAGGTVDAITATYAQAISLSNLVTCSFVALGANATPTPTFNPNTLGAKTIFTRGGQALKPGDIPGAGFVAYLQYNTSYASGAGGWELMNPAAHQESWGVVGGTANAMTLALAPAVTVLYDGLALKFRAVGANTVTTPSLNLNGLGAKTITKFGGQALVAGDIPRAGYECYAVYNLANTRWELLNPYYGGLNLGAVQGWTAQQYAAAVGVTSSSGVLALDCRYHQLCRITLTESVTSCTISNQVEGALVELIITGASSYTFSLSSSWKMADGSTVAVTPAAGKKTRVLAESDGTYMNIYGIIQES